MSQCKSCGAAIVWATYEESGKRVPLDIAPVAHGIIAKVGERDGAPLVRRLQPDEPYDVDRYNTHFATCPDAEQWRK